MKNHFEKDFKRKVYYFWLVKYIFHVFLSGQVVVCWCHKYNGNSLKINSLLNKMTK